MMLPFRNADNLQPGCNFLVPLPSDLDGRRSVAWCHDKRHADFLARLIAFAPQELLERAAGINESATV